MSVGFRPGETGVDQQQFSGTADDYVLDDGETEPPQHIRIIQ